MSSLTGWLTPGKEFVECQTYKHITIELLRDPRFSAIEKIAASLREVDEVEESCREAARQYGNTHAEWHCAEMAQDDAIRRAKRILLNNGFVRVGSTDDEIHFEGRPNVLKSKHQFLLDFAESYAAKAVFCPQR